MNRAGWSGVYSVANVMVWGAGIAWFAIRGATLGWNTERVGGFVLVAWGAVGAWVRWRRSRRETETPIGPVRPLAEFLRVPGDGAATRRDR